MYLHQCLPIRCIGLLLSINHLYEIKLPTKSHYFRIHQCLLCVPSSDILDEGTQKESKGNFYFIFQCSPSINPCLLLCYGLYTNTLYLPKSVEPQPRSKILLLLLLATTNPKIGYIEAIYAETLALLSGKRNLTINNTIQKKRRPGQISATT